MPEKVAIIGLGYVGLPLALALARKFPGTVGFDINEKKLAQLRDGNDATGEISPDLLRASSITLTSRIEDLKACTFFIVSVPTPVDQQKRPDLTPLVKASETVGKALTPGAVVVYESTVYPGVTEEVCGPVLQKVSGLKRGADFFLGYSPERINPGDKEHTLERITKVVSGEDGPTLERVAALYGAVVPAGIHRAPSIKVAEAAKVIENTQRDLNIALMNELAIIFDRMDICTADVLTAAGTKWNFLPFKPGLVGGHCIGVDPYYLTSKAEELGYHPQVILAGRRINDGMGAFVAQKLIKLLSQQELRVKGARVGVLGLTFKENVSDLRNSRVPDILAELREFGIQPLVHDPMVDAHDAKEEYKLDLVKLEELTQLDALIIAVPHRAFLTLSRPLLKNMLQPRGVIIDVKSMLKREAVPDGMMYWCL
jgi:UDP-N-acetyl-D-glucosamine/UDP-N-acetyl-D-galactosamine dehydrogenase